MKEERFRVNLLKMDTFYEKYVENTTFGAFLTDFEFANNKSQNEPFQFLKILLADKIVKTFVHRNER